MENPTLGIRCRIVARIPTGIHRFDGNSHKIGSDSYRIRVGPVVGLNLLGWLMNDGNRAFSGRLVHVHVYGENVDDIHNIHRLPRMLNMINERKQVTTVKRFPKAN